MSRRKIVAGNWKMNGSTGLVRDMAASLNNLSVADSTDIVICPPFPYLSQLNDALDNDDVYLGAQNINLLPEGAHTGEISTTMLHDFAVKYVIVGHSERRYLYGETNELVAGKVAAVLEAGLTPILCIGESADQRMSGETMEVLAKKLKAVIDLVDIEKFNDVVVAYEPLWAIGTGHTASPEMAQQTHEEIRQYLAGFDADVAKRVPLLYGGSVNARNFEDLFAQEDIDGALIGGASLKVEEFTLICDEAKESN